MKLLPRHLSQYAAFLLLAVLVAGCNGDGGIVPAKNFEQQLAYAYGTHSAVLVAAANAVEVGTLPVEDAQQVLRLADESRALLDMSRLALGVGDITTAQGQLTLATNILTQLNSYLNARAVK
jgi:hypothetical protein